MSSVRQRGAGLVALLFITAVLVACGRASPQEIDQALGITPPPTGDPALAARETATAEMPASAVAAGDGSPAGEGQATLTGNAALGRTSYQFRCATCHRAGGTAPDLLAAGGVGAGMTFDELYPIVREGENHPPGPQQEFAITDQDIANIAALIQQQAGP